MCSTVHTSSQLLCPAVVSMPKMAMNETLTTYNSPKFITKSSNLLGQVSMLLNMVPV